MLLILVPYLKSFNQETYDQVIKIMESYNGRDLSILPVRLAVASRNVTFVESFLKSKVLISSDFLHVEPFGKP